MTLPVKSKEAGASDCECMYNLRSMLQCLCSGDDREVVVRGAHDCWVVARHRNGRELYLVLEGKGEIGLAGAAKLATDFTDKHFSAIF